MNSHSIGKRAVVIGAGIGGLSTASALAPYFAEVLVLERDTLPSAPRPRKGVPQGTQAHGVLGGAVKALEELLPGFKNDLLAAGALPVNPGLDVLLEVPGVHPFPRCDWDWRIYSASRPLIELTLRRRIEREPKVQIRDGVHVVSLVRSRVGDMVIGVQCKTSNDTFDIVLADLVVDATGNGALTVSFLKASGNPLRRATSVGVDIRYATALFSAPDLTDVTAVVTFARIPESVRSGYLLPAENNTWQLLLIGRGNDMPPARGDAFLEYAQTLETRSIYDAVKNARQLTEPTRFGFPESVWRHFGEQEMPKGVLAVGDAICRLNPVYGQGMTVAAQEAKLLRDVLAKYASDVEPLSKVAKEYFRETEKLLEGPWQMSAVPDLCYPQTRGERPPDLERSLRFQEALMRLASRDAAVYELLTEVRHLLKPLSALQDSELVRQIEEEMTTEQV